MIKIQNKKALLITLIVAVISFIVLVTLVLPAMRDIRRLNEVMLARRAELDRLYRQGQSIRKVTLDLDGIAPEISRVSRSLPQEGEELAFITALEEIAERYKLESKLEFAKRDDSTKIPHLSGSLVVITLEGSYRGVYQYVAELESLPYYLIIQKLSISSGEASTRLFRQGGIAMAPNPSTDVPESGSAVSANLEAVIYWSKL